MSRPGVVFAGGGTGGHLFPAIAVLEHLRDTTPDLVARFLCSTRPIDARILGAQGVDFTPIPAAPLALRPAGVARFCRSWGGAVRASRMALRETIGACGGRERVRVLATGGFVAAPIVQAARAERVPVVMLNQDSPPGKANRWIARHAARVFTTASVERQGWELIPPVVRRAAVAPGDAGACRVMLGLDPSRPVLFVTGASQGSRSINEFLAAFVRSTSELLRSSGWQVLHQTGSAENDAWRGAYEAAGVPAVVEQFFDGMGVCWGAADCAVSRAGAGSVAEAWANAVPTLFLPYPHHRDQHQRRNAAPLERAGGAVIEDDRIEPGANMQHAGAILLALLGDAERRGRMRAALAGLGPVNGAEQIAAALLG